MQEFANITIDELREYMNRHREDQYVLVDVRQPEEYEEAHIPGAKLIPLGELSARLTELPADSDIFFY